MRARDEGGWWRVVVLPEARRAKERVGLQAGGGSCKRREQQVHSGFLPPKSPAPRSLCSSSLPRPSNGQAQWQISHGQGRGPEAGHRPDQQEPAGERGSWLAAARASRMRPPLPRPPAPSPVRRLPCHGENQANRPSTRQGRVRIRPLSLTLSLFPPSSHTSSPAAAASAARPPPRTCTRPTRAAGPACSQSWRRATWRS